MGAKQEDRVVRRRLWDPRRDAVKEALNLAAVPDRVLCRDHEQHAISSFCREHLEQQRAGSMYICGCPGTGKTLVMREVKRTLPKWAPQVKVVALNCMALSSPEHVYRAVLEQLEDSDSGSSKHDNAAPPLHRLRELLSAGGGAPEQPFFVLVLDELDQLISKSHSVLADLFALPAHKGSRCVLIGIANAINLPQRLLPTLRALKCAPQVVLFQAYTTKQIQAILQDRLKAGEEAATPPLYQPAALELCARKVAAASGDLRKALQVCRLALSISETESEAAAAAAFVECHTCEDGPVGRRRTGGTAPVSASAETTSPFQVRVSHMAHAVGLTFKSPVVDTIQALPHQQQLVLCSAVRMFGSCSSGKKKDATIAEVNSKYLQLCKLTALRALTGAEFGGVCNVLADQGLLQIGRGKEERQRRVTLKAHADDVTFALQDVRLFRTLLATESEA